MFYGLSVHKEFIQVCQLDAKGAKRKDYRIGGTAEEIDRWARDLGPSGQVVLEATFHSWAIHAIVAQYAGRVVVANPLQVKAIATTFYRVRRKKGHNVAVTALARKLIVLVWYMLHNGEPYRYASVESTRRKLRSLVPKNERPRALRPPRTVEEVYREAGLPALPLPSKAERRAAANNRRTRTCLTRAQAKN